MTQAPVSVVIPVHNGAELIAAALDSVFAQTRPPIEVIVVDDGSTDGTAGIVRSFHDAILIQQTQRGAAAARNAGARQATSPFLAFLDADDLWPATRLERQLALFAEDQTLDFVSGSLMPFSQGPDGGIVALQQPAASRLPSVLLLRRDAFWKVGGFSSQWQVGETIDWWARSVDIGLRGAAQSDTVLLRRVHDRNMGKTAATPNNSYLQMLHTVLNRRRTSGKL